MRSAVKPEKNTVFVDKWVFLLINTSEKPINKGFCDQYMNIIDENQGRISRDSMLFPARNSDTDMRRFPSGCISLIRT